MCIYTSTKHPIRLSTVLHTLIQLGLVMFRMVGYSLLRPHTYFLQKFTLNIVIQNYVYNEFYLLLLYLRYFIYICVLCNSDEFRCTSGECIDTVSMCGGTKTCADGSDETKIVCKQLNTTK